MIPVSRATRRLGHNRCRPQRLRGPHQGRCWAWRGRQPEVPQRKRLADPHGPHEQTRVTGIGQLSDLVSQHRRPCGGHHRRVVQGQRRARQAQSGRWVTPLNGFDAERGTSSPVATCHGPVPGGVRNVLPSLSPRFGTADGWRRLRHQSLRCCVRGRTGVKDIPIHLPDGVEATRRKPVAETTSPGLPGRSRLPPRSMPDGQDLNPTAGWHWRAISANVWVPLALPVPGDDRVGVRGGDRRWLIGSGSVMSTSRGTCTS